jgi:nitrite reductase/ring-hydroxylating ferredoxin subunit
MQSVTPTWQRVAPPGQPSEGLTQYGELAGGRRVLLARVQGKVYATQANCGHMRFPLGDGKLDGTILTCPLHKAQFDLTTGAAVKGPQIPFLIKGTKMGRGILSVAADPLQTYEVDERTDGVYVRGRVAVQ